MKKNTQYARLFWLLLLLIVTLFSSACATGGMTASLPAVHSKATATQPPAIVRIPSGPITYVALGASDAVGVGSSQPGAQGYVPLVAARLPKGSHLLNLGISRDRGGGGTLWGEAGGHFRPWQPAHGPSRIYQRRWVSSQSFGVCAVG